MPFALLMLAAVSHWIPARWNSNDAKSLELLAGTPVNCILLESAYWNGDLLKKSAERGIATLGVIHPGDDFAALAHSAASLKMNGVVIEGEYEPEAAAQVRSALAGSGLLVVELPIRRRIPLDSKDPILGTSQGLWPGIEVEHGGHVRSGPTSNPWIDTNTGFLRFLRAATDATLWIGVRPPANNAYTVQRYEAAIADAYASGARWIVALDDDLDRRLMAHDAHAVDDWKRIMGFLAYFESKDEWREYRPYSRFALVQDAASGGMLSSGLLDMLTVLHTSVRPIPTRRLSPESLHGARILLNVDAATINAQEKQSLDEFAAAGGVVVNPPKGWSFPQTSEQQMTPDRRQMNQIQGIWEVTYDATVRKNFGARTFNTASVLYNLLAKDDGKGLLIHLVNYADFAAETVTVQVLGGWKHARLYRPGMTVQELTGYSIKDGTGFDIDRIDVAATLKLDQ